MIAVGIVPIVSGEIRPGDVLRLGEDGPKFHVVRLTPVNNDTDELDRTRYLRPKSPRK